MMTLRWRIHWSAAVGTVLAVGCGGESGSGVFTGLNDGGTGIDGGGAAGGPNGTVVASGGSSSSAGPGGGLQSVTCGSTSCATPAQSCCVYESTKPPSYLFVVGSACPAVDGGAQGTALKCSGAANCPASTVCCVFEGPNKQVASDCKAACASNEAQLCDLNAPVSGCAPNTPCSSNSVTDWGVPKTYATCGGVGN